jgi:hypothetical protein
VLLLEIPGRSNRDNWPVQLRNDSAKEKAYQNAAKMEGFETSAERCIAGGMLAFFARPPSAQL